MCMLFYMLSFCIFISLSLNKESMSYYFLGGML